jgi:DNA-binding Xre family transcriptional regulator
MDRSRLIVYFYSQFKSSRTGMVREASIPQKQTGVKQIKYEVLEKSCEALEYNTADILEYTPEKK